MSRVKVYLAQLLDYNSEKSDLIEYFSPTEFFKAQKEFNNYLLKNHYIDKAETPNVPCHKLTYCELSKSNNFGIDGYGNLYKCEHHFDQPDKRVGDVFNGLYYNEYYFQQLIGLQDNLCEECNLYPICHMNCPEVHRTIKQTDNKCLRYDFLLNKVKTLSYYV